MKIPWTEIGAAIGTLLGLVNGLVLLHDRRQWITIDRVAGGTPLDFRITNRTRRPIPLQEIALLFRSKRGFGKWEVERSRPEVEGLSLPGILKPESTRQLHWTIRDVVASQVYRQFQVIVVTQTGKKIKSRRFRGANKALDTYFRKAADGLPENGQC